MPKLRFAATAMLLVATTAACTPLDNLLAGIFGRSMRDQPSLDPYELTIAPPENSVPFAAGNLTAGPFQFNIGQPERGADIPQFAADAVLRQAPELDSIVNPVAADQASLARGEEMYLRACAVCHGPSGLSADAYIVGKHPMLIAFQPAGVRVAGLSDGFIYAIIAAGRNLMPAYAHQVSYFDRWHIVNYVRTLQRAAGNTPIIDQAGVN